MREKASLKASGDKALDRDISKSIYLQVEIVFIDEKF